jgi:DNA-binding NarL/FixJ family response regulator
MDDAASSCPAPLDDYKRTICVLGNAPRAANLLDAGHLRLRVLLVDDHALFREGLARLLARRRDVVVVGQAENAADAIAQARELRPDLVLMEVDLPGDDGLSATRQLKAELPEIVVVMLSIRDDAARVVEAIKAGAQGYLSKGIRLPELVEQLHTIRRGQAALSGEVAAHLFDELRGQPGSGVQADLLTSREIEVLALVAAQLSNKEIAAQLMVSEHTAKNHLKHILHKLGLRNRRQAAAYAQAHSLVPPSE